MKKIITLFTFALVTLFTINSVYSQTVFTKSAKGYEVQKAFDKNYPELQTSVGALIDIFGPRMVLLSEWDGNNIADKISKKTLKSKNQETYHLVLTENPFIIWIYMDDTGRTRTERFPAERGYILPLKMYKYKVYYGLVK